MSDIISPTRAVVTPANKRRLMKDLELLKSESTTRSASRSALGNLGGINTPMRQSVGLKTIPSPASAKPINRAELLKKYTADAPVSIQDQLKENGAQIQEERQRFKRDLSAKDEQIDRLTYKISKLEHELNSAQEGFAALEADKALLESKVTSLREQNEELTERITQEASLADDQFAHIRTLEGEIVDLKDQISILQSEAQSSSTPMESAPFKEIAELFARNERMESQVLNRIRGMKQTLLAQKSELDAKREAMKVQIEEVKAAASAQSENSEDIKHLQSVIEDLQKQNGDLMAQMAAVKISEVVPKSVVDAIASSIENTPVKDQRALAAKTPVPAPASATKQTEMLTELRTQMDFLAEENRVWQESIEDLERELATVTEQRDTLRERLTELESVAANFESLRTQTEATASENLVLQKEHTELKDSLRKSCAEIVSLEEKLSATTAESKRHEGLHRDALRRISQLSRETGDFKRASEDARRHRQQVAERDCRINDLENELMATGKALNDTLARFDVVCAQFRDNEESRIADIQRQLDESSRAVAQISQERDRLRRENADLREELAELNEQVATSSPVSPNELAIAAEQEDDDITMASLSPRESKKSRRVTMSGTDMIARLNMKVVSQDESLQEARREIIRLSEENERLGVSVMEAEAEYSAKVAELQHQLQSATQDNAAKAMEVLDLDSSLESVRSVLRDHADALRPISAQMAQLLDGVLAASKVRNAQQHRAMAQANMAESERLIEEQWKDVGGGSNIHGDDEDSTAASEILVVQPKQRQQPHDEEEEEVTMGLRGLLATPQARRRPVLPADQRSPSRMSPMQL
eukprot:Clim_evm10s211 gene=Clim_evmTU10s211